MAQYGRPSTDTYNADLYTDQAGGSTNIYTTIDEVTASDADYVRTVVGPTSDVYVTKLTNLEDPLSSTGHIYRFRYAKSAAGGAQVDLTCQLRQGYVNEASQGTLIHSEALTNISETWTTTPITLTGPEADAITAYTDLYIRALFNQV